MSKKREDHLFASFKNQVERLLKKSYISGISENDDAQAFTEKVTMLVNGHSNKNTYVLVVGLLMAIILIMDISEDNDKAE